MKKSVPFKTGLMSILMVSCLAASAQSNFEKGETCRDGLFWLWTKCEYATVGPYGIRVGMNASELSSILPEIIEAKGLKSASAWKRYETGGAQPRDIGGSNNLKSDLLWADFFALDYSRNGKAGNLFYSLDKGVVVRIEWEWSVNLP